MSLFVDTHALGRRAGALRLEISPGIEPAGAPGYARHACVALDNWQPLAGRMAEAVGLRFGADAPHNTIAVLTLPERLLSKLGNSGADRARKDAPEACAELGAWMAEHTGWRIEPSGASSAGLCSGHSTRRSATRESKSGEFVGLHLDSWDGLPLDRRHGAQNRICVNLGRHTRALQFVPLQVAEVARRLRDLEARLGTDELSLRPSSVERFLRRCADQQVLRVLLDPGQAYIAPTENLLHDGCLLADGQDLTYVYRGHLVPQRPPHTSASGAEAP